MPCVTEFLQRFETTSDETLRDLPELQQLWKGGKIALIFMEIKTNLHFVKLL